MPAKTLAQAIDDKLVELHMTQETLAERIGVAGTTLRTWLFRDRFPRDGAAAIGRILFDGQSLAAMEKDFNIDPKKGWATGRAGRRSAEAQNLRAAFAGLDRQWAKIGTGLKVRFGYLNDLYRLLCKRSLFVFMGSTDSPVEFETHWGDELRAAIADGIANGGTLLYLRPTQEVIDRYISFGFQRILSLEDFQREIEGFRAAVADLLVLNHGMKPPDALELVRQRTPQYSFFNSVFFAPGFSLGCFQTPDRTRGQIARRMTLRVPNAFGGVWYLPEDPLFAGRFSRCVYQALAEQNEQLARRESALRRTRSKTEGKVAELQRDRETFKRVDALMRAKW
jgi:hypothetical protein